MKKSDVIVVAALFVAIIALEHIAHYVHPLPASDGEAGDLVAIGGLVALLGVFIGRQERSRDR